MGIMRVAKNSNYTVMNRTALNDTRLSWKAKGIMAYMLSMPDDWIFYFDELVKHSTDGKASFRAGFNELKKCGYVERRPVREGQRIKEWETIVHEVPLDNSLLTDFQHLEKQEVENQEVGFQEVENRTLLSTDSNQVLNKPNTDNLLSTNNNQPDKGFAKVIDFYEKNISIVRPMTGEKLGGLVDDFTADLVLYALEITASNPKVTNPIKYATSILKKWKENLVTTRQQAEIYESNRKRGSNNNGSDQGTTKIGNVDLGF